MGRGERHVFKKSPLSDNTDNRDKMKPNKSTNECRTQPDEVWQKISEKIEPERQELPETLKNKKPSQITKSEKGKGGKNKTQENTLNCIANKNPWRTVQKKRVKPTRIEKENLVGKIPRGKHRFPLDKDFCNQEAENKKKGELEQKIRKDNSLHNAQHKNSMQNRRHLSKSAKLTKNPNLIEKRGAPDWLNSSFNRNEN
jgi:hypothetical protein